METSDCTTRFIEIFKELKQEKIISSGSELSKIIGISYGFFKNIKRGSSNLPLKYLDVIEEKIGVKKIWMLTGEGEKYKLGKSALLLNNKEDLYTKYKNLMTHVLVNNKRIDELEKKIEKLERLVTKEIVHKRLK